MITVHRDAFAAFQIPHQCRQKSFVFTDGSNIGDDGYMVSNAWIGDYYVGTDGAMLVNTTTHELNEENIQKMLVDMNSAM